MVSYVNHSSPFREQMYLPHFEKHRGWCLLQIHCMGNMVFTTIFLARSLKLLRLTLGTIHQKTRQVLARRFESSCKALTAHSDLGSYYRNQLFHTNIPLLHLSHTRDLTVRVTWISVVHATFAFFVKTTKDASCGGEMITRKYPSYSLS